MSFNHPRTRADDLADNPVKPSSRIHGHFHEHPAGTGHHVHRHRHTDPSQEKVEHPHSTRTDLPAHKEPA